MIDDRECGGSLFWDICFKSTKKVDWGCWVVKMTKREILNFLNQEKRINSPSVKRLMKTALTLDTNKEYLLVALELW